MHTRLLLCLGLAGIHIQAQRPEEALGRSFVHDLLQTGPAFATDAAEGNYRVKLKLGSAEQACVTTVQAESRRLMLEKVKTMRGEFVTRTIVVNVRNSLIDGGGAVRLKDREKGALHWDNRLSLEFIGSPACPVSAEIEKIDSLPTIFLAGDSTVTDQTKEPDASWGQMLTRFFGPTVAIANHAESGESLKSFIAEGRLEKVMSQIRAGDYLFIQFGHNDMKQNLPRTYVEPFTTYKAYLKIFIAEARRRGAKPVLVTSMHRRNFDAEGKILNTLGDFPEAVRQTAKEENVPLIDLHSMSAVFYEALGPEKAPLAFAANGKDATHHNSYGAYELARMVVEGIKSAVPALAAHLTEDTGTFNPAHPDPIASTQSTLVIVGDSTASNGSERGWGDHFAKYFDVAKLKVLNRARGGRSSRTFFTEGLWQNALEELNQGDFVLIQFGHNDGGPPDQGRARGSLPGIGEDAREFTLANGTRETVHSFGWYLRKFIRDAKAKGAHPILLALTVRNIWRDGRVERGSGHFGNWSASVAQAEGIPWVDVSNIIANAYEREGEAATKALFPEDHTHTSAEGAASNAAAVAAGLNGLKDAPLKAFLSATGAGTPAYQTGAEMPTPRYPMPLPANPKLRSIFLIGDSTVRNGRADGALGQWGWGEPLSGLIDPSTFNVVNRALGGLSSRTYLTLGHWDRVLAMLKQGDVVLMQFGHNDGGALDDKQRARASIRGIGAETQEIENPITGHHETVHSYGWYLRQFISGAQQKGAIPVVLSPVPRKVWKDGKIARSREDYGGWAADVARDSSVAFLDLNELAARRYEALGPAAVEKLFGDERTHTNRNGAELNAQCVLEGLSSLAGNPLGLKSTRSAID